MFRLQWHVLPENKAIYVALTYIFGVWISTSKKILGELKIPTEKKVWALDDKEIKAITDVIKEMVLENDLRREVASNIKRLKEIKCYRGMRHNLGLPVRGQNTRKRWATAKKLLGRSRVRPVLKK